MRKENLTEDEKRLLDENLVKQEQKIYETILQWLKSYSDNGVNDLGLGVCASTFKYCGGFAYMLGLDFVDQTYINKEVCENAKKRIDQFLTGTDVEKEYAVKCFINFIYETDIEKFAPFVEVYNSAVDKSITLEKNSIDLSKMFYNIRKVLNNSFIKVKYIYDLGQIFNKPTHELTYRDILKINSTISEHANYIGDKAIKAFGFLYSDKNWVELLKDAVLAFDMIKYGNIFYEYIVSFKEFLLRNDKDIVVSAILGNITDEQYDQFKNEFEQNSESVKPEEPKKDTIANDDIDEIMKTDAIKTILILSNEAYSGDMLNGDDFVKGLYDCIKSPEYMADIYKYIKAAANNITGKETIGDFDIEVDDILNSLETELNNLRYKYKTLAESVCENLEPENAKIIQKYIFDIISNMIISSVDEKRYLVSMYFDTKITTIQHVMQIISLLENGDIIASEDNIVTYTKLFDFVKTNYEKQFKDAEELNPIHDNISFILAVKQLFDRWISKKSE